MKHSSGRSDANDKTHLNHVDLFPHWNNDYLDALINPKGPLGVASAYNQYIYEWSLIPHLPSPASQIPR